MGRLYRGVSRELDSLNGGKLVPRGANSEVTLRYDRSGSHDGKFTHGPTQDNAVRAHHIKSGLYDGCFLSFTRSEDAARNFATDFGRVSGIVYVVDEGLLGTFGVVAVEFQNPQEPEEVEVSLRAADNGSLPDGIVVERLFCEP